MSKVQAKMFVLMGPCGCGKSFLGKLISQELKITFIEGDELHSESNINKMKSKIPLEDSDRYPWLQAIIDKATKLANEKNSPCILISCSALKFSYRNFLRKNLIEQNIIVWFIYLKVDKQILKERMQKRDNHFMVVDMLESQFKDLEEPNNEENTVIIEADNNTDLVKKVIVENMKVSSAIY
ncbi:thermoresistant gluconokinase [Gigaspora rosea]|uniref:Gluconokinase n=1 Tax=Gigaspora rosea TaxID=44941 RepID=A0A397W9S1_9GLOM|nr:thermoresistant gluconokinase [Gigaspora rosea]